MTKCDYCNKTLNGHCFIINEVGVFCEQCVVNGMTEYFGSKLLRDEE